MHGIQVPHTKTAADNSIEFTQPSDKADWDAFVVKVNKSLDNLDLEFRHLLDESSGKELYAIVGVNLVYYGYLLPPSFRSIGKAMK